jgi:hypothetical protein
MRLAMPRPLPARHLEAGIGGAGSLPEPVGLPKAGSPVVVFEIPNAGSGVGREPPTVTALVPVGCIAPVVLELFALAGVSDNVSFCPVAEAQLRYCFDPKQLTWYAAPPF